MRLPRIETPCPKTGAPKNLPRNPAQETCQEESVEMKTAAKVGLLVEPRIKIEKKKVRHAAEAILKELGPVKKELSIFLTGDSTIKGLNKKYRHIDRPTDVLSFPM